MKNRMLAEELKKVGVSRRDWLRLLSAGVLGSSVSGWLGDLAAAQPKPKRSCILLWMSGGPSQLDTFDPKPGHDNGGEFNAIATSVPGIRISEHLPKVARWMKRMSLVRSITSNEGDHGLATSFAHRGYRRDRILQYPTLGSLVANELGRSDSPLPSFVSIAPYRFQFADAAWSPGFLGPHYAPLIIANQRAGSASTETDPQYDRALRVENVKPDETVPAKRHQQRFDLLSQLNREFVARHPGVPSHNAKVAADRAVRLMRSAGKAFDLGEEPNKAREAYGTSLFGQSCLLARRLVERGVPFVEVSLSQRSAEGIIGWDSHRNNFTIVRNLSTVLDVAWSQLMADLDTRGLLDSTLIVWMGEFGRTPRINQRGGRDHYPQAWSAVLAGGGIKGGQVVGRTSKDGTTIRERPVPIRDFLATAVTALGIDPGRQNTSNIGRPISIVDPKAQPIRELL